MSARTARPALAAASVLLLLAALAGCAPDAGTDAPPSDSGAGSTTEESTDETMEDTPADAGMVVLPGTGSYAIGTEAPYGGYQLTGEPVEVPAGCTWSIVDADGAVAFADQGGYVFLTDIPEAVTFITDGCPDWEQFE
ncbi:putative small lipoprotein YifL [Leifsonia sp. AK011]|uniref:hypothetical protein n=1 Tax=Leifsonia sp. AK011 TaxID=2723075 RepID=UPI0015C700FD|nr:hypothetical protein [Leifsonia sp. AK011]NYF08860.1 putative small lipoprotein YifL [Leifsonia sp. AK011]